MVQPRALVSFARGLGAVGASPVILIAVFLAVLVLWSAMTAYAGLVASTSGNMAQFLSLPPIHSFLDLGMLAPGTFGIGAAVAFGALLLAFRALLTAFLIAAIDVTLRGSAGWREVLTISVRRMLASFWVILAFEAGFVASVLATSLAFILGPQVGTILSVAWLIAGLYYLVYCEVIVVVERASARDALAWGWQAARLPGRDHALLVFAYAVFALLVPNIVAGRGVLSATPSVAVWGYALFLAFLNVSVLAAFTWRWELLSEPVRAGAGARGTRPRRPSILGMFGVRS